LKSFISPKIIFIVGATAVGKTDVALEIAKHLPCEIVSCDAMQVYQDVSIASSKPTLDERKAVVHHVLDMVSVEKKFDVSLFNQAARSAIDKILKSQKYPLVVGGSGMYMQVLLDGIFEVGGQDVSVRKKLEDRLMQEGAETLYAELQSVDPQAAAKIHVQDTRRIVRALEVFQITQVPISQLQKKTFRSLAALSCCGIWFESTADRTLPKD
jgi:tRNA dimethylallyltransferase